MENNGTSETARSDRKSKKVIMVSRKSHTECEQDRVSYLLIIHSYCKKTVGLFNFQTSRLRRYHYIKLCVPRKYAHLVVKNYWQD